MRMAKKKKNAKKEQSWRVSALRQRRALSQGLLLAFAGSLGSLGSLRQDDGGINFTDPSIH